MRDFDDLPEIIEIEPTEHCNLRCTMCHVSFMPAERRPLLDMRLLDKLSILKKCYFIIGSSFEPTIHPDFHNLLDFIKEGKHRVELVTNGTKLTNEIHDKLLENDVAIVTVSFDGACQETYERIRRNGKYDEVVENISSLCEAFKENNSLIAINYTAMRSNMREIPDAVKLWESKGIDQIRLISMVVRENDERLLKESLYPVKDDYFSILEATAKMVISNDMRVTLRSPYFSSSRFRKLLLCEQTDDCLVSSNPMAKKIPMNRQMLQLQHGQGAGADGDCISPFTFARIISSGEVLLCNRFSIGNLVDDNFEDIWFGDRATELRRTVKKDDGPCNRCDYYKFCLKSNQLDLDQWSFYISSNTDQTKDSSVTGFNDLNVRHEIIELDGKNKLELHNGQ